MLIWQIFHSRKGYQCNFMSTWSLILHNYHVSAMKNQFFWGPVVKIAKKLLIFSVRVCIVYNTYLRQLLEACEVIDYWNYFIRSMSYNILFPEISMTFELSQVFETISGFSVRNDFHSSWGIFPIHFAAKPPCRFWGSVCNFAIRHKVRP